MLLAGAASAGAAEMSLTSADIKPGARFADEQVGDAFGCAGANVSPGLSWSGAPKGAKSFAIAVHDPDAPVSGGFWHWLMVDIPADADALAKNAGDPKAGLAPPGAAQARNDAGSRGYFGPCPPSGDKPHHYHIELYALDVDRLDADPDASASVVASKLKLHALAKATLIGLMGR